MSYQESNVGEIKLDSNAPVWLVNLVASLENVPIDEAEKHLTKLRNEVCLRKVLHQVDGAAK